MSSHLLLERLSVLGQITSPHATLTPLSGGVSSEIYLVRDGARAFVIKRALPRLKVKDDWFADPARNAVEKNCLEYLERIQPGSVPKVLFHDTDCGLFGMEYLDDRFTNWKADLLRGETRDEDARRAGALLGRLHRASWGNEEVARTFATVDNFYALRIESYLVTTARRHPSLQPIFEEEADRLRGSAVALVHGDYSPKNILRNAERLVILDCEVAWYGDPAFDLAFLLNHLLLKSIYDSNRRADFLRLAGIARQAYVEALAEWFTSDLERRVSRLLLMLMLARVDGKSPVEYLTDEAKKAVIRSFVAEQLPRSVATLDELIGLWRSRLEQL